MSSAAIALAIGAAAPALAQDETVNAASPPPGLAAPSAEDAVGPVQLRDFSINGTVTRRAETPETAPAATATTAPATTAERETASAAPAASQSAAGAAGRQAATRPPATASTSTASAFDFPPPTPSSAQPATFAPATFPQPTADAAANPVADTESGFVSLWPWLLALLAAAGATLWYFRRNHSRHAFAGAGGSAFSFDLSPPPPPARPRAAPAPQPQPAPRAPVPEAAPKPATAPVGIVSTRLRPWLEIEFQPEAAIVDAEKGAIQFEVTVFNSGSAPARDVAVEAALFNASPDQDQVIGAFFARPTAQGDRITIPPLQRMSFRSVVSLPREQLRLFEVEGRTLLVPVVGFNALYRWSSGEGQTSASFIVGRNSSGEKMAPFRVDQGPKTFRGLAAHEHTLRVRK